MFTGLLILFILPLIVMRGQHAEDLSRGTLRIALRTLYFTARLHNNNFYP